MSVVVAGLAIIVMSFFNLTMGIFGRALVPYPADLPAGKTDHIYPVLISQLETVGFKGIVAAGIFAASISTYDSIGSSMSALLTRDVYARLLVRNRNDRHYLRVGRWFTPLVIGISFFYMPFLLKGTMLFFFLDLTSTFVIPLLTLYLMGRFSRVHRSSGTIGLLLGGAYGILRLFGPSIEQAWQISVLPAAMRNAFAAYPFSMLITAGSMVLVSVVRGWQPRGVAFAESHQERIGWLRSSQQAVRELVQQEEVAHRGSDGLLPAVLALVVIVLGSVLSFVVFW